MHTVRGLPTMGCFCCTGRRRVVAVPTVAMTTGSDRVGRSVHYRYGRRTDGDLFFVHDHFDCEPLQN